MRYLAVVCGVGLIFILYEVVLYGISAYILHRSPSLKTDFLWCLVLAIPFALTELLWLRGWRIAENAGMTVWTADILFLLCAVIGSSIAMVMFFKEIPTITQIFGLILVTIGGIIAAWK
jgi:hypothetical protein